MTIRLIVALSLLCSSVVATAQLSGRFYLEKSRYALGEPIFVYFEIVNTGQKAAKFYSGDPYSACSNYRLIVSHTPAYSPALLQQYDENPSSIRSLCGSKPGGIQSISVCCAVLSPTLLPGEKRTERVLLNFAHKLNAPGQYTLEAERNDSFGSLGDKDEPEARSTLSFQVDEDAAKRAIFESWVAQLKSRDGGKEREAALTLASVAPQFLEDTLLELADNSYLRDYAPLAFHRLNTPRSKVAMINLLTKTEPRSWVHQKAADYISNEKCSSHF